MLPYNPNNKKYAKKNRHQYNMTKTEWIMWNVVLRRDKTWYRFLRQKPIWNYILDFYCHELRLWIEIDGSSHYWRERYDYYRTLYLNSLWLEIIRYSNYSVHHELERVIVDLKDKIAKIKERLSKTHKKLTLSQKGP